MQRDDVFLKGTSPSLFFIKSNKKTKDIDILSILALLEMAISLNFTPMILKNLKFNIYLVGSKKYSK